MKTTKYSIRHREEGRGRWATTRFSTLAAASQYIQDRWQGDEYRDSRDTFHTDYCQYELIGFEFQDIGIIAFEDGCRTFKFKNLEVNPDGKARIVAIDAGPDDDCQHYRATEAYIQQQEAKGRLIGVWTDAQYLKHFGKAYVPTVLDDHVIGTMEEEHTKHGNPEDHTYCPLCQAAYKELHKNDPSEQVPF